MDDTIDIAAVKSIIANLEEREQCIDGYDRHFRAMAMDSWRLGYEMLNCPEREAREILTSIKTCFGKSAADRFRLFAGLTEDEFAEELDDYISECRDSDIDTPTEEGLARLIKRAQRRKILRS
jgi:hypothetical protein